MTVSFHVCSAVFDYAVALSNAGRTDRVTVPVQVDGVAGFSNLLLGPATQLYCTSTDGDAADGDAADPSDTEFVAELARRTALLTAPAATVQPNEHAGTPGAIADLDFDFE